MRITISIPSDTDAETVKRRTRKRRTPRRWPPITRNSTTLKGLFQRYWGTKKGKHNIALTTVIVIVALAFLAGVYYATKSLNEAFVALTSLGGACGGFASVLEFAKEEDVTAGIVMKYLGRLATFWGGAGLVAILFFNDAIT